MLRNPIIANVFYGLNIIEQFGTGIARINNQYIKSVSKPRFDIGENSICIILPVIEINKLDLPEDDIAIYNLLKEEVEMSRAELDKRTGFNKSKTLRILANLESKG